MTDRLERIFNCQFELATRFHRIEEGHGLLETPDFPVKLDTARGQARLRNFAWRIVEECGELLEATEQADIEAEFSDVFHFLVELCLGSGIDPSFLMPEADGDRLEYLFTTHGRTWHPKRIAVLCFIQSIASAINELKFRPWKVNPRPTNVDRFRSKLRAAFAEFITMASNYLFDANDLDRIYFDKHAENIKRIETRA